MALFRDMPIPTSTLMTPFSRLLSPPISPFPLSLNSRRSSSFWLPCFKRRMAIHRGDRETAQHGFFLWLNLDSRTAWRTSPLQKGGDVSIPWAGKARYECAGRGKREEPRTAPRSRFSVAGAMGTEYYPASMCEATSNVGVLTDRELLERYLAGDLAVGEELFFRLSKILHILIRRKAPAYGVDLKVYQPDDLVQEHIRRLREKNCRRLRGFGNRSSLYHWIDTVVSRWFIDLVRSKKFRQRLKTEPIGGERKGGIEEEPGPGAVVADTDPAPGPVEILVHRELIELVREAVTKCLSDEDQIIMRYWGLEYKEREIAAIMGMIEATVATRVSRAKATIAAYVAEKEPDLSLKRKRPPTEFRKRT